MTEELPLCECGCGLRVTKLGNRFIHGHYLRGKKFSKKTIIEREKKRKENKSKPIPERKLCKCGCGELAEPRNDYIHGHNMKGD